MNELPIILYVDDEPLNLRLFEMSFKRYFKVITASSGTEGLEILKANPGIMVTISDMRMPLMNGIQFISLARSFFPDMVYFILTGYDITEEIAEAIQDKLIHKYFRKPFNVNEIVESVESYIQ